MTAPTNLPKSVTSKIISDAFWALHRACMRTGLVPALETTLQVLEQDERTHRRMGRAFTRGQAKYRLSVADTARFWLVRILEQVDLSMSAAQFSELNERWSAVAKLKFAMESRRLHAAKYYPSTTAVQLSGYPNASHDDHDTLGWFRTYYSRTILVDISPKYWPLMQAELEGGSDASTNVPPYMDVPPYMGVDYARDIAVKP